MMLHGWHPRRLPSVKELESLMRRAAGAAKRGSGTVEYVRFLPVVTTAAGGLRVFRPMSELCQEETLDDSPSLGSRVGQWYVFFLRWQHATVDMLLFFRLAGTQKEALRKHRKIGDGKAGEGNDE